MRGRFGASVALAGIACLTGGPAAAAAAPEQARVVGPVRINDSNLLARHGWTLRSQPAPHLVTNGLLRALPDAGSLLPDPRGGVVLLGRYGWVFRGRDAEHLRTVGWRYTASHGATQSLLLADGGWLLVDDPGVTSGAIIGLAPDLSVRWGSLYPPGVLRGPVALSADGTLYTVGGAIFEGTPSAVDARTGAVVAALQDPAPNFTTPVVAPDGTLRVIGGPVPSVSSAPQSLSLYAYDRQGRQMWRTPLSDAPIGQTASAPSIGSDGAAYVAAWTGNGAGRGVAVLSAIGPDGSLRWRVPIRGAVSRPAIDTRGFVWTLTRHGSAIAIDPAGSVAFVRRVSPAEGWSNVGAVALGEGVLAEAGPYHVRLEARSSTAASDPVRLTATPAASVRVRPLTCVAPPAGRPRTCLFPARAGAQVEIRTPVDQNVRLSVRRAGETKVLYRQGPYRILAGDNRIRLDLAGGAVCNAFFPCSVPPGRYVVSASLRVAPGRSRVLSAPVRVFAGSGRAIG